MSSGRLKKTSSLEKRKSAMAHTSVDLGSNRGSTSSLTSSSSCQSDCLVHGAGGGGGGSGGRGGGDSSRVDCSVPRGSVPPKQSQANKGHISINDTGSSSSLPLTPITGSPSALSSSILARFASHSRSLDYTTSTSAHCSCKGISTQSSTLSSPSTSQVTSSSQLSSCKVNTGSCTLATGGGGGGSGGEVSASFTSGVTRYIQKQHASHKLHRYCSSGGARESSSSSSVTSTSGRGCSTKSGKQFTRAVSVDSAGASGNLIASSSSASQGTLRGGERKKDEQERISYDWRLDASSSSSRDDAVEAGEEDERRARLLQASGYTSLPSSSLQLSSGSFCCSSPSSHQADSATFHFGSLVDVSHKGKKVHEKVTSESICGSPLAASTAKHHQHQLQHLISQQQQQQQQKQKQQKQQQHPFLTRSPHLVSSHENLTTGLTSGNKKSSLPCIVIHDAISTSLSSSSSPPPVSSSSPCPCSTSPPCSSTSHSYTQKHQLKHTKQQGKCTHSQGESGVSHQSSLPGLRSKFEMLTKSFSVDSAQSTGSMSLPQSPSPSSLLTVSPLSSSSSIFSNSSSSFSSSSASSFATTVEANRVLVW